MKKNISLAMALSFIIIITSCGGGGGNYRQVMKIPEQKFYQGKYKEAANMLKPLAAKQDKDQLLYMMEAGYMFHIAGDYKLSNYILQKASAIAKLKPISISKQVKSLLTNQRATNYRGEDFEKVLIRMYSGINYLMLGNYDEARVEFKGLNEELAKIKVEGKAKYKQNIMAKYLTGIAFEAIADKLKDEEDLEFALIEYRQINRLMPRFRMAFGDTRRLDRRMDSNKKWDIKKGELILIFQSGRGAVKKSRGGLLESADMKANIHIHLSRISLKQGVTIAAILLALKNAENPIPKFVKRSNLAKYVKIIIDGKTYRTQMLENIEQTAIKNLEDDYVNLKAKLAASIVTKAAVSIAAGIAAKQIAKKMGAGAFSGLIGQVAGAGTGAALFSQMKPDLRCWHTLPANLQIGRVSLDPGKHRMELQYISRRNRVLKKENYTITIEKGKKIFFNVRTLN